MFASPNCLLHVATKTSPVVYTVIHFWLLLTQPVSVTTMDSDNNNNYYDVSFNDQHLQPSPHHLNSAAEFESLQQLLQQLLLLLPPPSTPLTDKTLTHCDTSKDNTNWRPVCATTNGVDYVLFSSECLLWQTNRVQRPHHVSYTGDSQPVFREIAMGFCRPDCNVVIFESNEEALCAKNLRNDEVHLFSGYSEMARDVCLHANEWQPISDAACVNNAPTDPTINSSERITTLSTTKTTTNSTIILPETENQLNKQTTNFPKKQTKHSQRKAIPCPKIFNPVCAELCGVKATFINECLVNAENVKFGKNWQIFSEGVCAEDYASSERRKKIVKKRSLSDDATVTYNLHTSDEMGLNDGKALWTPSNEQLYYLNSNVMTDLYGRQLQPLAQPYTVRILPNVDDLVTECKFGVAPVCGGSSNRAAHEFENICQLILRNVMLNETWSVVDKNKCAEKCILNCNTNYDPFCISRNGINYTIINQCHVDKAFCRYKHSDIQILGKGECKNVLESIRSLSDSTQTNPNEKYSPRLVRKILESSAENGATSNSLSSLLPETFPVEGVTDNSAEFVVAPKTSLQTSAESSIENSTRNPLNNATATLKPSWREKGVSESHIMNLWQSSKMKSDKKDK